MHLFYSQCVLAWEIFKLDETIKTKSAVTFPREPGVDLGFQKGGGGGGGGGGANIYACGKKVDEHMEHALSRGVWGHAPTGKFSKFG